MQDSTTYLRATTVPLGQLRKDFFRASARFAIRAALSAMDFAGPAAAFVVGGDCSALLGFFAPPPALPVVALGAALGAACLQTRRAKHVRRVAAATPKKATGAPSILCLCFSPLFGFQP